jgi:hypothetical protein
LGSTGDSPVSDEAQATIGSLRTETASVRDLLRACREDGVDVASFQQRIQTTRELVTGRRFDDALRQLTELKAEMLAQILLHEAQPPIPPGEVENPPVEASPPEDVLSSLNRPPAWKVKIPKR